MEFSPAGGFGGGEAERVCDFGQGKWGNCDLGIEKIAREV